MSGRIQAHCRLPPCQSQGALPLNELNKKFKVIGITDSWLNHENTNNFGLEGYKCINTGCV